MVLDHLSEYADMIAANQLESGGDAPTITGHARGRWCERSDMPTVDPATAWEDGLTVEVPEKEYSEARLYPPAEVVLLRQDEAIVTVLCAGRCHISSGGLFRCSSCGQVTRFQRSRDGCEWCETPLAGVTESGVRIERNVGTGGTEAQR